jgi:hypothetical protein
MQAKLTDEKLLPLVKAIEQATGQRPHLSTAIRWCTRGCASVKLESRILGGKSRLTSEQAVLRFMDGVTAAKDGILTPATPTPRQQTLAATRAAKRLAERVR